ncbi:MAG TPA: DUF3488 and transglutaminase-like domain-containing protein [Cellvibrio sp.]|nr:DUF3488 and transglutaminase-like domain-containing protein [Cellvibrio sp.]
MTSRKIKAVSPPMTRQSLLWLFAVQSLVLAPHYFSVPGWIGLLWLGVCFWRWKIFRGAWNYPGKLAKTLIVLLATAGLVLSLGKGFSLIAMVSLLLVGSILKLLEIKTRKDFVLLLFISLLVLATQFIFFDDFLAAVYGIVCLTVIFAALLQLYQQADAQPFWLQLRTSGFMLVQAIPIMVLLFVAMPRLGAFWSMPVPESAKTGLSDSMSPGDISELSLSDELVFRATFVDKIPANEQLYWRSLVLSVFDGRRWSRDRWREQDLQSSLQPIAGWREQIDYRGDSIRYNIVAEPFAQRWLYVLGAAQVWSEELLLGRDLHLQARAPLDKRISYDVTATLDYGLDVTAEKNEKRFAPFLQLPVQGNPQTRQIAADWLRETGSVDALIEKLFAYYRSDFTYTLQPPLLGNNSVDEFLWQTRQGFCEHFASSFVFFMRSVGVPARVLVGYQGGELNRAENYLAIRQRDAHAWAEIWLQGRGWVSVDPTSAVAPQRIRSGIIESLSATERKLLSRPFGSSFELFKTLHQQWDALNFQWVRWVLNYDSQLQSGLLSQLLDDVSPWRVALLVLGVGAGSIALTFMLLFLRERRRYRPQGEHAAHTIYRQLCKKLKRAGFAPEASETPRQFLSRVIARWPAMALPLTPINDLFERLAYAEQDEVLAELKQSVRYLRLPRPPRLF